MEDLQRNLDNAITDIVIKSVFTLKESLKEESGGEISIDDSFHQWAVAELRNRIHVVAR